MYSYLEEVKADVLQAIKDNYESPTTNEGWEDLEEQLNDDLWIDDSVTGNGSGSYFFNSHKAEKALAGNWSLLLEALQEFGFEGENPMEKGAEWCDVTIRCYLLPSAIAEVLDDLREVGSNG